MIRLRDGEREIEVHGSAAFCRQTLEDLPALFARLRADLPRGASIALPAPSPGARAGTNAAVVAGIPDIELASIEATPPPPVAAPEPPVEPKRPAVVVLKAVRTARADAPGARRRQRHADADAVVRVTAPAPAAEEPDGGEATVLSTLRAIGRAATIAELRRRLPEELSGQAVRRILERAGGQVVNVGGKPAAYRAR